MPLKLIGFTFLFCSYGLFSQTDSSAYHTLSTDSSKADLNFTVFNGPDAELEMEEQEVSSLLSASRDIYAQFSNFQFGAGRFRIRGASPKNQQVMVNGINMSDPQTGWSSWSNWGGLNDVTRLVEVGTGNTSSHYGFSGPLGYVNIDVKASSFKKGTRSSIAQSNRQFRNRWMLTHTTGTDRNGWALALSASNRSGALYVPGTYISAYSLFVSADKRLTEEHLLSLTVFAAPTERGGSGMHQQEVFQLTGTNYYNSAWGFQNGRARNSSIRKSLKPVLILSHNYTPETTTQLNTSVAFTFGRSSFSGLNWNQTANPQPDYYRYLPSYQYSINDEQKGDNLRDRWRYDLDTRQINWDKLIAMNRANLYSIPSPTGQPVNTTETRARYILENRVENSKNIVFNTTFNKRFGKITFSAGMNAQIYETRKYKEIEDLLGASFWLDYDQFAQGLGVESFIQQNNIDEPDKKILTAGKFGYDYKLHIRKKEGWSQIEYREGRSEIYAGLSLSHHKIWKESFMANGKFPSTSKGFSEILFFTNYGLKTGMLFKITGRQYISADGSFLVRLPDVNTLFISPDVRNDVVSQLRNEKISSGELSYIIKSPDFKLRITTYCIQTNDQMRIKTYWSDVSNNFINYILTGINQRQSGVELGIEKTIFVSHNLQCAVGAGHYIYTNRPMAQAWQNNNNASLFSDRTVYLKNFRIGGTPQTVIGIGYRYISSHRWHAGINFNYFDQIYTEINPDRRTVESVGKYSVDELELAQETTDQEQLDAYFVFNALAGKSFHFSKKYILNINLSVNNLLNNTKIIVSGAEQLRWDPQYPQRFPSKYTYMPGATYMAGINLNF